MTVTCSIRGCKSIHRGKLTQNYEIKFYRFPLSNEKILKRWIAATGRINWLPYSDSRICSLHFRNDDYYKFNIGPSQRRRLKPYVIPTQNIYTKMRVHEISDYDQNNSITPEEQRLNRLTNEQNNKHITSLISKCSNFSDCSNCSSCNELFSKYEKLHKRVVEFKHSFSQEKKLNWQASVFQIIIDKKEAVLKKKLEMAKNKNKTLNKRIQQKEKTLANLKISIEDLKSKRILKDDTAFKLNKTQTGDIQHSDPLPCLFDHTYYQTSKLSNESDDLPVLLLQDKKKK